MSVTVRPYMGGPNWEVDIRVTMPDRSVVRERKKAPVSSRSGAKRWGQAREREILLEGPKQEEKEVAPTLREFVPRFIEKYAEANRLKPSGIAAKKTIFAKHLIPQLGDRRVDEINNEDVQLLKSQLLNRSPKTVNNVLSTLNTVLKVAVEWGVMSQKPCQIKLLKVPRSERAFHDFEPFERLVETARATDRQTHLIVLLGGEAGLRCGEMMALEWKDIDLKRQPAHVVVERSAWKGHVTTTKGGRSRRIPLTSRLAEALKAHKHLRGPRVLSDEKGAPLTQRLVQGLVERASRKAGLNDRGVHILRHTFCSHLAMRGASVRAIQELAGHQNLSTTQMYMHLSPAALEDAIGLLNTPKSLQNRGGIVEVAGNATSEPFV